MGCNGLTPNVICSTDPRLANSLAHTMLDLTPAPNLPGQVNGTERNYTPPNPPTGTVNADSTVFDLRVDHYWKEADHFSVTVHYFGSFGNNQTIYPAEIASNSFRMPNYDFANRFNWDHTFRPNLLNNFNLGYNDILSVVTCANLGNWQGVIPSIPGTRDNRLSPSIQIAGYSSYGCGSDGETTRPAYIANDRLVWVKGKHTLGFGGEYRALLDKEISSGNPSGSFAHNALNTGLINEISGHGMASFVLGYMSNASMGLITLADQHIRQKVVTAYISDTWKATPKFTLNFGVRWDTYTPTKDKYDRASFMDPNLANPLAPGYNGVINWAGDYAGPASLGRSYPETIHYKNFAPRIGFAYAVTPKTVVRAGYGIFFSPIQYPGWSSGVSPGRVGFNNTFTVPSPDGGFTPIGFLQDGLPPVPANQEPPFFDQTVANGRNPGLYREYSPARGAYSQQWNLTIEKQIGPDSHVSVAYVGNKGTRIVSQMLHINTPELSNLSLGEDLYHQFAPGDTSFAGVSIPYAGWVEQMQQCTPTVAQALSPFPHYCGTISNRGEHAGNSSYHSFQAKYERRFSRGLWVLTSYTFSKFISTYADVQADSVNSGGSSGIISPHQRERFKALDNQDVPHTLSIAMMYELPFGKGKRFQNQGGVANAVLGGWQLTNIWRSQSGIPLFWFSSNCRIPGQFRAGCNPGVLQGADPFLQDKSSFDPDQPLFDRAAFEDGGVMLFNPGASGRTTPFRGFGFHNHNMSLQKTTSITERVKFQFRAEFFNLWNWHAFARGTTWGEGGSFNNNLGSPSFGRVTGQVSAPRNIQLGAKIIF